MRSIVLSGGLLVLCACASSSTQETGIVPSTRVTTQTVVSGPGGATMGMNMINEAAANSAEIAGNVTVAWSALQSAYASLEIPLSFRDEAKKSLGNSSFRTRRRIGSVPMIRAVDCGGESGMPNAETYDVTLEIISQLTPTPDGKTRLQTLVQGSARRPSSGAVNDARCTSIGGLEKKIAEMVQAIVAGK